MVRATISTANIFHPPKPFNYTSDSLILQRFIALLNSCSSEKEFFKIRAQFLISGLQHNSDITARIIQFCTSNSFRTNRSVHLINHAQFTLYSSGILEHSAWNNVIRAFVTSNRGSEREAIWVFVEMRRLGIRPNEHTFPFLFKGCSSFLGLNEGRQIHGDVMKHGYVYNVYVQNTLIHFYGSCKKVLDSYKVFDEMLYRTVVSWNSMILACIESSWFYDSIEVFIKMTDGGIEQDQTTMVVVLSAIAELGNLSMGKWIHSRVISRCIMINCQLGTALVDMYGKSGDVNYARLVFDRMVYRNVWTWSSMIIGFAQHGYAKCALELFTEMSNCSVKPNHVTFLGVLCACSHAGLVEDGKCYFHEMENMHGIKPTMVHFGAMVDVLGRAGLLKEAYNFIMQMPVEADSIVWRTLLSACNIHDTNDYSGVGVKVRNILIELEPKRSGNLVMVANNYAEAGLWQEAENLRTRMRDRGLKKMAGESCVEVGGFNYRFVSGDYSCIACEEICLLLTRLNLHVKMINLSEYSLINEF
ncbi:pentatricopeptide repeat-containing protein At2g36730 [Henckelia pumila]|uniref:pentatricopeptide repeat-containing protein At2g36730 n=1 Tax=Henckelia pumila TaxID=405737 RepID=UPI003C6E9364